mgnify:CR=1 FL=1
MSLLNLAESGKIPDFLIRKGIKNLCQQRLLDEGCNDAEQADRRFNDLIKKLKESPVAIETQAANEQHYELPTEFFKLCRFKFEVQPSCVKHEKPHAGF